jgi:hypothetical protein
MYSPHASLPLQRHQHYRTPFRSHSDDLVSVSSSVPVFQPSLSQITQSRHNLRCTANHGASAAANVVVVYVNCRLVGSTSPLLLDPIRILVSPRARLSDVWTAVVARGGHLEIAGVRLSGKVEQISADFGYVPIAVLSIDDEVSNDPNDFQSFLFVVRGQRDKAEFHPRDDPGSRDVHCHYYSRRHHARIYEGPEARSKKKPRKHVYDARLRSTGGILRRSRSFGSMPYHSRVAVSPSTMIPNQGLTQSAPLPVPQHPDLHGSRPSPYYHLQQRYNSLPQSSYQAYNPHLDQRQQQHHGYPNSPVSMSYPPSFASAQRFTMFPMHLAPPWGAMGMSPRF